MTSNYCLEIVFIIGLVLVCTNAEGKIFNVLSYGAKADGVTDDSKAFSNTWTDACKWNGKATLLIPLGVYKVHATNFSGPCKEFALTFQIKGIIKAPSHPTLNCNMSWISFQYMNGLEIGGGGTLDGQGPSAWGKHHCKNLPLTLGFSFINNAVVRDIHSINSKHVHFKVFSCNNMTFSHVNITAPGNSPNTDGIHIALSTNIHVLDSNIGTGDDCIAIITGSKNINISGVTCGPGHGISIGSLGSSPNEVVKDIHVKNCTLIATQNGVRIKTWGSSDVGNVTHITFEDIVMKRVWNPMIIDQHYCPNHNCSSQESSVQIKNVTFKNIRGTSSSRAAVTLYCSASFPCKEIILNDINLVYHGPHEPAIASCTHAKGKATGKELPPSCLTKSLNS
ncbi:exopolygalacturonase-like [Solanum dulcamara]|uniref:exopolygalacturonase-like n=1 Tax=Solanum dulcamara TaxID=45834 RepID=UPI002485599B|nr:exopolygalacturonase-like [Solanum dulcamara]